MGKIATTPLNERVWKRYTRPFEGASDVLRRVATYVAEKGESPAIGANDHVGGAPGELWADAYYELMASGKFLPNSPTLMNAGRGEGQNQLAACFVLPLEDDMKSIMTSLTHQVLIHKSGGGTGFNFSRLRPKGAMVGSTNGVASGPVSFLSLFDKATSVVQQGGMRRGANMGILDWRHRDALDFVNAKADGTLTNFNISLAVDGEFFALLDAGDARVSELWETLTANAWKNGDPGLVFLDRINEGNTVPHLGDLEATNPCVTGDTLILTDTGYQRIDDLVNKRVNVWNGEEWSEVVPTITGENQPIMEISFSDGSTLKCTPYHKFLVQDGFARDGRCFEAKAEELRAGMRIAKFKFPIIPGGSGGMSESEAYINGFYSGDGSTPDARGRHIIRVYGGKKKLIPYLIHHAKQYNCNIEDKSTLVADPKVMREKFWVPGTECSVSERLAWLAGLIDADGSKNSIDGSVNITSINRDFLMQVKRMVNTLGENATVALTHNERTKKMPDGHGGLKEYNCQACYRLIINASTIERLKRIGLKLHRVDVHPATDRDASRFLRVTGVRLIELKERYVYCFNEPKRHMGVFNGVLTFQCGESPLLPYEACNLGSLNLAAFVDEEGHLEWGKLRPAVVTAVHFLNDVISACDYPLPEIERNVLQTRKIGLGVMGWADCLALMGIHYASDEAVDLARAISQEIRQIATLTSETLARVLGPFPAYKEALGYPPRRNATLTCIAPTGSISLLAGCSSGIEPHFARSYTRRIVERDGDVTVDVEAPVLEEVRRRYPCTPVDSLVPTALEIPPVWHVRHQAAWQTGVHLAVSKTVNLPASATVEQVREIYHMAYDLGCKGITVYRDGSKGSQVLTNNEPKKAQVLVSAPKKAGRPDELTGRTRKVPTVFGNLYLTVNEMDGSPFEVFATLGKGGKEVSAATEAMGRLISLGLRHGVPMEEVVRQLKGIAGEQPVFDEEGTIKSLPDAIGRALERMGGKPVTVNGASLCPDCGSVLLHEEGCQKCVCGFSKC